MTEKLFKNLEKVIRLLTESQNLLSKEIRNNLRSDEIADLAMFPRLSCATDSQPEASSSLQAARKTEADGTSEDSFIYLEFLLTRICNLSLNLKDDQEYLEKLLLSHKF